MDPAAMKIAIVIGHNREAQGAVRVTDGVSEYAWNGRLAEAIQSLNPAQVRVFRRTPFEAGYSAELRAAYAQVDAWGADVSAELHFNAAIAGATGTETLFASVRGREVATVVQAAMVGALGLRDRGLVHRPAGSRGSASLISGKAPAVLLEPYFGSNALDCQRADQRFDALARAIFIGLGGVEAVSAPVEPLPATPPSYSVEARLAALEARMTAVERKG